METMSSEEKQKIVDAISKKGAILRCPRCNQKNFTLLDGYFNQSIQPALTSNLIIGGSSVPYVVVVCNNCGYMSQHALGVLGLMPKEEKKNESITENKFKIILIKHIKEIADKKLWLTPLGIFITLILIPLTTEGFKNAFSIPSSVWQAGCYIAIVIFLIWTIYSIIIAISNRKITIESLLDKIKQKSDRPTN